MLELLPNIMFDWLLEATTRPMGLIMHVYISLVVKYEPQVQIWSLFSIVIDQDMDITQFGIHVIFQHGN
jgi:hypothetical protein